MDRTTARQLLDQIGIVRHAGDLDLLLFFLRHRRMLLTSEHLASLLGYEVKQIAESLDTLIDAGLIQRTLNPAHAARLYVLVPTETDGGWLPALRQLASTRAGRLALMDALAERSTDSKNEPLAFAVRGKAVRTG